MSNKKKKKRIFWANWCWVIFCCNESRAHAQTWTLSQTTWNIVKLYTILVRILDLTTGNQLLPFTGSVFIMCVENRSWYEKMIGYVFWSMTLPLKNNCLCTRWDTVIERMMYVLKQKAGYETLQWKLNIK